MLAAGPWPRHSNLCLHLFCQPAGRGTGRPCRTPLLVETDTLQQRTAISPGLHRCLTSYFGPVTVWDCGTGRPASDGYHFKQRLHTARPCALCPRYTPSTALCPGDHGQRQCNHCPSSTLPCTVVAGHTVHCVTLGIPHSTLSVAPHLANHSQKQPGFTLAITAMHCSVLRGQINLASCVLLGTAATQTR